MVRHNVSAEGRATAPTWPGLFFGNVAQLRKDSTMLVLSRHKNEEIKIGDNIRVAVVEIRGDKVRLGIEAPKEVPVHRREVSEAIMREKGPGTGD
jgi:carbon storage regulator